MRSLSLYIRVHARVVKVKRKTSFWYFPYTYLYCGIFRCTNFYAIITKWQRCIIERQFCTSIFCQTADVYVDFLQNQSLDVLSYIGQAKQTLQFPKIVDILLTNNVYLHGKVNYLSL